MSCSSKHKIAVQGVLGCMILLLGFWHIRYSYANKLNNKACTMADSEKAMRTIEKAIKLNPMNPVYYANMGLLYAATDTAINLRNYMALSKVSSEALDKSLAYFHLANNMAPKNRLFSLNLGLLYALNGKYLKAKSFFEKAVENSDEEENVLLWALFCESHKQFVEAKRAFVKALIIAPYLLETDIYAKLEKHNYCYWIEIVENVVKILSVRKGDPINMAKLGSVLLYKGDKIEAEKLFIESLEVMCGLSRPWYALGQLAENKGDSIKAYIFYKRGMSLDSPITLSDRRNLINKNELTEYSLKSKALDIINIYENTYNTSLIDKRIILMDTLSIHKRRHPKSHNRVGFFLILLFMKELNLKQMESVNGGLESDCKGALVSLGMGVAGVVLSAASLGSGPVGWVSGLSYGLSLAGTSFSGIQTIGSCF